VGWREGRLLHLSEEVLRVTVEDQLTIGDEWVVPMRPHLRHIEDVPGVLRLIPHGHDLHGGGPRGELAVLDGLEEVAGGGVEVAAALHFSGLHSGEVSDALIAPVVELHPHSLPLGVDPLVSVGGEAVHVTVRGGDTAVGEEERELMDALRHQRGEVPKRVRVLQIRLRVTLLSVDEVRELYSHAGWVEGVRTGGRGCVGGDDGKSWCCSVFDLLRVSDEKDGGVVSDHVVDALLCVVFDGESSGVSGYVAAALLPSDCAEASEDGRSLPHCGEELRSGVLRHVVGDLEVPVGTGPLRVDDPLRDALAVEVGELVDEGHVLEKEGTGGAHTETVLIVIDGGAVARGEEGGSGGTVGLVGAGHGGGEGSGEGEGDEERSMAQERAQRRSEK
jgi:hypothetical protein